MDRTLIALALIANVVMLLILVVYDVEGVVKLLCSTIGIVSAIFMFICIPNDKGKYGGFMVRNDNIKNMFKLLKSYERNHITEVQPQKQRNTLAPPDESFTNFQPDFKYKGNKKWKQPNIYSGDDSDELHEGSFMTSKLTKYYIDGYWTPNMENIYKEYKDFTDWWPNRFNDNSFVYMRRVQNKLDVLNEFKKYKNVKTLIAHPSVSQIVRIDRRSEILKYQNVINVCLNIFYDHGLNPDEKVLLMNLAIVDKYKYNPQNCREDLMLKNIDDFINEAEEIIIQQLRMCIEFCDHIENKKANDEAVKIVESYQITPQDVVATIMSYIHTKRLPAYNIDERNYIAIKLLVQALYAQEKVDLEFCDLRKCRDDKTVPIIYDKENSNLISIIPCGKHIAKLKESYAIINYLKSGNHLNKPMSSDDNIFIESLNNFLKGKVESGSELRGFVKDISGTLKLKLHDVLNNLGIDFKTTTDLKQVCSEFKLIHEMLCQVFPSILEPFDNEYKGGKNSKPSVDQIKKYLFNYLVYVNKENDSFDSESSFDVHRYKMIINSILYEPKIETLLANVRILNTEFQLPSESDMDTIVSAAVNQLRERRRISESRNEYDQGDQSEPRPIYIENPLKLKLNSKPQHFGAHRDPMANSPANILNW